MSWFFESEATKLIYITQNLIRAFLGWKALFGSALSSQFELSAIRGAQGRFANSEFKVCKSLFLKIGQCKLFQRSRTGVVRNLRERRALLSYENRKVAFAAENGHKL
jgi:hypothetical protein